MNNVMKQSLLKSYKKANKQRRQSILKKYGYTSEEQYLAFLESRDVESTPVENNKLDVVYAFDSTGSMNMYIRAVKDSVREVIPGILKQGDVMMKIVAFGDYCDMTDSQTFGKAYQESAFTKDQETLENFVKSTQRTDGGDGDEFYELVLDKIATETPWREDARRLIVLIADAEPHKPGYSYVCGGKQYSKNIDMKDVVAKLKEMHIMVDTTLIHDYLHWMKDLSAATEGNSVLFKSSKNTIELMNAATAYRVNKGEFATKFSVAASSGDTELTGMYKSFKSEDF